MKRLIVLILILISFSFSQVWMSQFGNMQKRVYDSNNDGIVDVAMYSLYGPSNSYFSAFASNAQWALWSFSNSNSLYADTAGNSIFFDNQRPEFYQNIGSLGEHVIGFMYDFASNGFPLNTWTNVGTNAISFIPYSAESTSLNKWTSWAFEIGYDTNGSTQSIPIAIRIGSNLLYDGSGSSLQTSANGLWQLGTPPLTTNSFYTPGNIDMMITNFSSDQTTNGRYFIYLKVFSFGF